MIYHNYYSNVSSGVIDPKNVNYSCYVVGWMYVPKPEHNKAQVTDRIETLVKVLIGGDISTLDMSKIIDKVKSKLEPDELAKAAGFVCYDIASGDLNFFEYL